MSVTVITAELVSLFFSTVKVTFNQTRVGA